MSVDSSLTANRATYPSIKPVLLTAGICLTVYYLKDVLTPFCIALTVAYLLNPLVHAVQQRVHHRGVAVCCTLLGIVTLFAYCSTFILDLIVKEARQSGALLEGFLNNKEMLLKTKHLFSPYLLKQLQIYLSQRNIIHLLQQQEPVALLQTIAQHVLPGAWSVFASVIGLILGIVGILIMLLYTVFILIDFDNVKSKLDYFFSQQANHNLKKMMLLFKEMTHRYFRSQMYICIILSILFTIGFKLIGLPLALTLGGCVGLLNMVPYLSFIGLVPATLLAGLQSLETGQSFLTLLALVIAVFAAVQIVQDMLLTPRIMGKATGLSPAWLLLSISIWGELLGFLGLILAIPLTCLFIAICKHALMGTAGFEPATSTV